MTVLNDKVVALDLSETNARNAAPPELGSLTQLTYLSFEDTHIDTLPSTISNLSLLKTLDLEYPHLNSLTKEIGSLSQLEHLNHKGTSVPNLPSEVSNLTQLKVLNLYLSKHR